MSKQEERRCGSLAAAWRRRDNNRPFNRPKDACFLRSGGALAGAAVASVTGITAARSAAPRGFRRPEKEMGRIIEP